MTRTPRPGFPVRGSLTGRPIMVLLDLLGRRQALRVIWELRAQRLTFRDLQRACDQASPTVLNRRLRELRDSRLVDLRSGEGYGLTPLGHQLREFLGPLREWSENQWAPGYVSGTGSPPLGPKKTTQTVRSSVKSSKR